MLFFVRYKKILAMHITGKLIKILESQSGKSSNGIWKKQDFIIETLDVYPKKICISNWNDKIDLEKVEVGTIIDVYIQIESRQYNNKWYTNLKAWKMELTTMANQDNVTENKSEDSLSSENYSDNSVEGDLPF